MKKIYSLFLILIIATGCYEDKGNYAYKDIQEITIDNISHPSYPYSVTVGEKIEIKPDIKPDISKEVIENPDRYVFKWILNNETRPEWNKKDFIWVADRPTRLDLDKEDIILEITDTRHGTKYTGKGTVKVNPEFVASRGYIILSEDESGNSKLHYMKYLDLDGERPDPVTPTSKISYPLAVKQYLNIYESQNENESLGRGPISIQQHYISWPRGTQFCIFQQSGAIDIEASALKKEGEFKSSFEGGSYPEGVSYLTNGSMMKWFDVMSDQRGRLFSRVKYEDNLYNTGTFIKNPIMYMGEELENCEIYRNPYSYYHGTFIFDKKNGRILFMFDGGADDPWASKQKSAGLIIPIPKPIKGIPDDCRDFNDFKNCEILELNIDDDGEKFYIVYKDETGKIMMQKTKMKKKSSVPTFNNTAMESHEITNVPANFSKVYMPQTYSRNYIYIIADNKLYLVDINSGYFGAELYYTAESGITSIYAPNTPRTVIICTENGYFYELDAENAKNKVTAKIADELKLIWKQGGFGKVVDVNFCEFSTH